MIFTVIQLRCSIVTRVYFYTSQGIAFLGERGYSIADQNLSLVYLLLNMKKNFELLKKQAEINKL